MRSVFGPKEQEKRKKEGDGEIFIIRFKIPSEARIPYTALPIKFYRNVELLIDSWVNWKPKCIVKVTPSNVYRLRSSVNSQRFQKGESRPFGKRPHCLIKTSSSPAGSLRTLQHRFPKGYYLAPPRTSRQSLTSPRVSGMRALSYRVSANSVRIYFIEINVNINRRDCTVFNTGRKVTWMDLFESKFSWHWVLDTI